VADRQTRELFTLHNVYCESPKHPNALPKDEVFKLYETLRRGKHLNIGSIWQASFSSLPLVYVIQENLTSWHQLKHQLANHPEVFTESTVASIATELLRALDHLHSNLGIAHCSVDLHTVVCSDRLPDKFSSHFKLVGFEQARFIDSPNLPVLTVDSESLHFHPPELMLRNQQSVVTSASDIWSLGVLIMRLMSCNFQHIESLANLSGLQGKE
jgi:serine/threonine protein kinase